MKKEPDFTYHIKSQDLIAQGALTNSKRPECFVKGVYQTHVKKAHGPYVWDVEDRQLFDFICGMGSMLIGHGNEIIARSIYQQATKGITYSLSSTIELELAEALKEILPWADKFKFLKTGTEACMAAIRIARAKTGRPWILSEGYHGWSDEFTSLTPPALGCNQMTFPNMYKLATIDQLSNMMYAAVIVEPIQTDMSPKRIEWLRSLKEACEKTGTLLIFDEIITGFRVPKYTFARYLDIEPDIICLGKAIGGGLPLSCLAGKAAVMNCGEYFVSSTFAGETCSMAACLALIDLLKTSKYSLNELWGAGKCFQDKFNTLFPERLVLSGYPSRCVFSGDPETKALFWQECYRAGILFGSSYFLSFAHLPYLERITNVMADIFMRIKTGSVVLEGELPKSPFAQKVREQQGVINEIRT